MSVTSFPCFVIYIKPGISLHSKLSFIFLSKACKQKAPLDKRYDPQAAYWVTYFCHAVIFPTLTLCTHYRSVPAGALVSGELFDTEDTKNFG